MHRSVVKIDDDIVAVDPYWIGLDSHLRIYETATRCDLKRPLVPWAAKHFAVAVDSQVGCIGGWRRGCVDVPGQFTGAEGTSLVRADVAQGVQVAVDVEDADASAAAKGHDDLAIAPGESPRLWQ